MSPLYWNVYCDDLLKELRMLGAGCHFAGDYVGNNMYVDDLIHMQAVCERYERENKISLTIGT